MRSSQQKNDVFAQARTEKRLIFQENWNRFITAPQFLAAVITYTAAQIFFFLFSGDFILRQGLFIGIASQPGNWLQRLIILGIQILLSVPGGLFCAGLWLLRRKTRWNGEDTPDISGIRLLRITNLGITIITGILLAIYPTVIIYAGEYIEETALYRVFYLFLVATLMLIVSATLLRTVFRQAEENILCCWSEQRFVLPLLMVFPGVILAVFLFAKLSDLFFIGVIFLAAVNFWVLLLYWLFLRKVGSIHEKIDRQAIASREDPDDPYKRY